MAVRSVLPYRFDAPRLLFESSATEFYPSGMPNRSWAISPDGQRFLLQLFPENAAYNPVTTLHVVLNWAEELTRLVKPK